MSRIIVDDELRAKLKGSLSDVELCDKLGHSLAFIVSPDDYRQLMYAKARERHSEAEIEELRRQTSGRPLNEILSDLGAA